MLIVAYGLLSRSTYRTCPPLSHGNRACFRARKPLVSGTAINYIGQLSVFDLRDEAAPCYACVVPEDTPSTVDQCSTSGVLAPLTGTIGTMQATEIINFLVFGESRLSGRMLLYDARESQWNAVPVRKRGACSVCGSIQ